MNTKEKLMETIKKMPATYTTDSHGNQNKPIFLVMTAEYPIPETHEMSAFGFGVTQVQGFYYELDDAINAVETNAADICETCFGSAFVIARYPGLYDSSDPSLRLFFLFNKQTNTYVLADEPAIFENIGL